MGMLLRFNTRTPRTAPVAQLGGNDTAEILLFTGVRYERDDVASKSKSTRPKQTARKGRTKL